MRHCSKIFEITGVSEIPLYPSTPLRDLPAFGIGTKVLIPKALGTYSVRIIQLNNFVITEYKIGWAFFKCSPDMESAPGALPFFSFSIAVVTTLSDTIYSTKLSLHM